MELTIVTNMTSPPAKTGLTRGLTTPKKRWMLQWNEQHQPEATAASPTEPQEAFEERDREQEMPAVITIKSAVVLMEKEDFKADASGAEDGEVMSDAEPGEVKDVANPLRVTMPPPAETSSLSPSANRGSPTGRSSISPSCKLKDVDGNMSTVRSRTPSPARVLLNETPKGKPSPQKTPTVEQPPTERTKRSSPEPEVLVELTESERQRLERRKKKKTNWDVGDPRKHGGTVDLAALNLLSSTNAPATHPASFARFPRNRPAYRHSHSLEHKESPFFRRANSTGTMISGSAPLGAPPRHVLHHSASMPPDRARTSGRPPFRYPPSTGGHK